MKMIRVRFSNKCFLTGKPYIGWQMKNPNYGGEVDSLGYPVGYGPTQPQVLMASFMSAYSGVDPNKIKFNPFPKIPYPQLAFNLYVEAAFNPCANISIIQYFTLPIFILYRRFSYGY
ncbi:MAG: hypothetical protein MZV63_32025 [Marinilabiliales bacterium]|nr:hypothetical protein [Marinilabiliales bacterium]